MFTELSADLTLALDAVIETDHDIVGSLIFKADVVRDVLTRQIDVELRCLCAALFEGVGHQRESSGDDSERREHEAYTARLAVAPVISDVRNDIDYSSDETNGGEYRFLLFMIFSSFSAVKSLENGSYRKIILLVRTVYS